MEKSFKVLVAFAIFSNALCLDLSQILGIRTDWREPSSRTVEPEIVEVVRWRQPVCVVPGPGVPPCLSTLKKYQEDYEKNSARGIEVDRSRKLGNSADDEKQIDDMKKRKSNFFEEEDSFEDDSSADFSTEVLSPLVVDSFEVDNVDRVELESSGGFSFDDSLSLNLRSNTPGIEKARGRRQGKYLVISGLGKSAPTVRKPPAIYVTKVLNSPVTATLVANNCFPDIGVPVCDDYQETITIYKNPETPIIAETQIATDSENTDEVVDTSENDSEVNEQTQDFWNDPTDPHFDDGTAQNEPHKPTTLLGQVVQHVINKPGVVNAIPSEVIDVIANNPGIIEAVANSGSTGEHSSGNVVTTIDETQLKPQVVANPETSHNVVVVSSTPKPGLISSFFEIQRPGILDNFWTPGFNIFNKSTTQKPEVASVNSQKPASHNSQSSSGGPINGGLLSQTIGQGPVIQAIQDLINKPQTVSTNEQIEFKPVLVIEPTKKPGLFQNLWNPGNFGIFDKISPTAKPQVVKDDQEATVSEVTKSDRPEFVEVPEKPKITEILFKPENDISERPALPDIFNKVTVNNEKQEAKPTQAPGFFGGLFGNPARPEETQESADDTKTLLAFGNSMFTKPTNKPLVIERPGEKPLLIERPIYVEEKPPKHAGLLNFFIPSGNKPLLTVDHEVIKEPVYVYQKPPTPSGLLSNVFGNGVNPSKPGFFQGWAIFGNRDKDNQKPIKIEESQLTVEPAQQPAEESQTIESFPEKEEQPAASIIIEETNEDSESVLEDATPSDITRTLLTNVREESTITEEADTMISPKGKHVEEISVPVVDVVEQKFEKVPQISVSEEAAPVSTVPEEIAEAVAPLESQTESTVPAEAVQEEIASDSNSELVESTEVYRTDLRSIVEPDVSENETTESSANLEELIATERDIEVAGVAEAIEETPDQIQEVIVSKLVDIVKEAEDLEKEAVIDNEA